jgi:hypothetical protein
MERWFALQFKRTATSAAQKYADVKVQEGQHCWAEPTVEPCLLLQGCGTACAWHLLHGGRVQDEQQHAQLVGSEEEVGCGWTALNASKADGELGALAGAGCDDATAQEAAALRGNEAVACGVSGNQDECKIALACCALCASDGDWLLPVDLASTRAFFHRGRMPTGHECRAAAFACAKSRTRREETGALAAPEEDWQCIAAPPCA